MEDRLRECPRCKSEHVGIIEVRFINESRPECHNCKLAGPYQKSIQDSVEWWNTRATDPLLEKMASYIKMIINLYDFKENDLWMEDGGKLLKKYREATCQVEKK